ncbi:MAG: glycosyltransferase family 2 protein [Gammaproteobacteria bacterium]|nr:glycosyltransferase family 2 protein [Gammaproteobacteria bacterium]MBU1654625.1 glycosyltransferase family 2 protein [Gammaproteobacteria bacterium]MBU1959955.1 glycosyltransferase family 2 protein [Gammaproteobacteria bacterium]
MVDNSADDAENRSLRSHLEVLRTCPNGPSIEILTPDANLGFGGGVQLGMDRLQREGRYRALLVINNDAIAQEGMVGEMLRVFDEQGGRALVTPRPANGAMLSMLWYHRLFALVLMRPRFGAFPYFSGACLLVPTALGRDYLFDPDFFMYGEDVELSWWAGKAGMPLIVAKIACDHLGSASSRLGSLFYEYHVARGHILLGRKLARGPMGRLLLMAGRMLSLPLRASLRCLRHGSLVPWRALVLAWRCKPPAAPAT